MPQLVQLAIKLPLFDGIGGDVAARLKRLSGSSAGADATIFELLVVSNSAATSSSSRRRKNAHLIFVATIHSR